MLHAPPSCHRRNKKGKNQNRVFEAGPPPLAGMENNNFSIVLNRLAKNCSALFEHLNTFFEQFEHFFEQYIMEDKGDPL